MILTIVVFVLIDNSYGLATPKLIVPTVFEVSTKSGYWFSWMIFCWVLMIGLVLLISQIISDQLQDLNLFTFDSNIQQKSEQKEHLRSFFGLYDVENIHSIIIINLFF